MCQPVGTGEGALKYLAPYIFRVAISNNRLLAMDEEEHTVTFRYTDSRTGAYRRCTVSAEEFIRRSRSVQHVLPKGFVKVRYYGLFSPSNRPLLVWLREHLGCAILLPASEKSSPLDTTLRCPQCGVAMVVEETIRPQSRHPP